MRIERNSGCKAFSAAPGTQCSMTCTENLVGFIIIISPGLQVAVGLREAAEEARGVGIKTNPSLGRWEGSRLRQRKVGILCWLGGFCEEPRPGGWQTSHGARRHLPPGAAAARQLAQLRSSGKHCGQGSPRANGRVGPGNSMACNQQTFS